jgi:hypothetical protein
VPQAFAGNEAREAYLLLSPRLIFLVRGSLRSVPYAPCRALWLVFLAWLVPFGFNQALTPKRDYRRWCNVGLTVWIPRRCSAQACFAAFAPINLAVFFVANAFAAGYVVG